MIRTISAILLAACLCLSAVLVAGPFPAEPVLTPRVDEITGAQIGITYAHHEIHGGRSFTFHWESDPTDTETIGDEGALHFLTPAAASGLIHVIVDVQADDECVFQIREGPTVTASQGTGEDPLNRNRESLGDSAVMDDTGGNNSVTTYTVAEAAAGDLSTGATILHHETLAIGGVAPFASVLNTTSRGQREFVCEAGEDYVFIVTCSTNNDTAIEITLNWYEHVDADFVN